MSERGVDLARSVFIEDELRKSYLAYSMSMITARALPDVRDGLKPVHRRVLFAMSELGLDYGKPPKKCARVCGDVVGKYHPHGEGAVYDALVRLAQDFSMRYTLVAGQGNFGSIDGDAPAAMRYTECRLSRIAEEMLADIEKETVDFSPNYDDSMQEPKVLPSKIPCLLVNGSTGIAVGMATNMAPHNLREVVDGVVAVIDDPRIEITELCRHIPGPDFPTGGIIYGRGGIYEAYRTGRGKIQVRAAARIEETKSGKEQIIVTEIPYMVNKSGLVKRMAELVREKTIDGIQTIRDESDREGLRIVVEMRKDAFAEIVLNSLYKYTAMQTTFGINNLALVKGRPRQLNLKELICLFIDHRLEVVTRRAEHERRQAAQRAHILEGLRIALDNIDAIVSLIRSSSSAEEAHARLIKQFGLSDVQAKAILEMRLQRLTGLERGKIEKEYGELSEKVRDLRSLLESRERRMGLIKGELLDIKARYGDERRTEIVDDEGEVEVEDMIADEDMVVTMTRQGYIKRCATGVYRSQGRGGRGVKGMDSKEEDFVVSLFVASAHSYVLFFTNTGRCYRLKVYRIPEAGRQSRGRPIVNLLQLKPGEEVASYVPVREFDDRHFVVIATGRGVVNKQPLKAYAHIRGGGINAINLDAGDRVVACRLTEGESDIMLCSKSGRAIRFHESAVRELGRHTHGVRGIRLKAGDEVVGVIVASDDDSILTVTNKGYGKRTVVGEYRETDRGGMGIINIRTTARNGVVAGVRNVRPEDDAMLITKNGIIIRCDAGRISEIGRNTQGVRLINLDEGDEVIDLTLCEKQREERGEE